MKVRSNVVFYNLTRIDEKRKFYNFCNRNKKWNEFKVDIYKKGIKYRIGLIKQKH